MSIYDCVPNWSFPASYTIGLQISTLRTRLSKEDHCRNGNADCELEGKHEQVLVRELMRAIEDYNNKEDIDICPLSLRDTMLAIAALLHLEAAKTGSKDADKPHPSGRNISNAFAKAARTALEDVSSARAALVPSRGRN